MWGEASVTSLPNSVPCLWPFPHRSAGLFHGRHRWSRTCLWISPALSSDMCPRPDWSAVRRPLWLSVKCMQISFRVQLQQECVDIHRIFLYKMNFRTLLGNYVLLHQALMKQSHMPQDFLRRCWSEPPWQMRPRFLENTREKNTNKRINKIKSPPTAPPKQTARPKRDSVLPMIHGDQSVSCLSAFIEMPPSKTWRQKTLWCTKGRSLRKGFWQLAWQITQWTTYNLTWTRRS